MVDKAMSTLLNIVLPTILAFWIRPWKAQAKILHTVLPYSQKFSRTEIFAIFAIFGTFRENKMRKKNRIFGIAKIKTAKIYFLKIEI